MQSRMIPLASSPGTIRLWVGAGPISRLPDVDGWLVDGKPLRKPPRPVIDWAFVRAPSSPNPPSSMNPSIATGVWELDLPRGAAALPDAMPTFAVHLDGRRVVCNAAPLPAEVPPAGGTLRILLCSCFDVGTSEPLLAELARNLLSGAQRPHLTLWLGDQVYLDQPLSRRVFTDRASLEAHVEECYRRNWFDAVGLGPLLALAPNAFIPDDHEYWNNFPRATALAPETFVPAPRSWWRQTADRLFERYQLGAGAAKWPAMGQPITVNVAPLSLLMLDTRSQRDGPELLTPSAVLALRKWATGVATSKDIDCAALVTGQSLLAEDQSWLAERAQDAELPDSLAGYRQLLDAFDRIVEAGKRVLLITGDVHYGRISEIRRRDGQPAGWEVIASPISKVADPRDGLREGLNLFRTNPAAWPAHAEPEAPPPQLPAARALEALGPRPQYAAGQKAGQRGNHIAMLTIERNGSGLAARVDYLPVVPPGRTVPTAPATRIDLRPAQ